MSAVSDPSRAARAARDPRLDLFRGLGMFIILFAHIPNNAFADWIPARFGFSDATEIFVFCSGMASALAFGRVFDRAGLALGAARIAHRIWQVYWAHIAVFLAIVAALAFADEATGAMRYVRHELNLGPFLDDPARRILGLLTLTYVPNYFDILPMYLGILALVPIAMAAERRGGPALAGALCLGLWVLAALGALELPAETWGPGRAWFFNPFSWQLVFFLGFGFVRGWLRPPPADRRLVALAAAGLALAAPFSCQYGWSCYAAWGTVPWLGEAHDWLAPANGKTHLGILRVGHFLCLAYLSYLAAGPGGSRLRRMPGVEIVSLVGRQTLAVFLAGLWLAQVLGVVLDVVGRNAVTVALANLGGCALLVLVAALVEWFKGSPWAVRGPARARAPADDAEVSARPRLNLAAR
ncbi:MAG: OpgC domain-containing protein [Methylobacteriaceae bacterium]|nr:OpgC domain-containing protein [Methylobacteriaceae bacterium]